MAQKTQGTIFAVGTATASTKAITAITAASPPVVTSAAHGYANGAIVYLDSIGGMVQLNKRAFVVANQAANTFELKGVDGTNYTTYTSGGTAALKTMTTVGEVAAISNLFDGQSNEIETTNLQSTAEEFLIGIQRFGSNAMTVFCPSPNDTGQTRMRALKALATAEAFSVTLPSGQISAFMGLVKSFAVSDISPDGVVKADLAIRNASEPSFFA
jgi:hypothetical protein